MSKRILVIDDEPDIREIASLSLGRVGGHTVLTADSGREGVQTAAAERPDAILLDMMMPGMDGAETAQELRGGDATAGIPIVMLTAKVQPGDRERFTELDVAGVIAKPFDPMALPGQLAELVGWS